MGFLATYCLEQYSSEVYHWDPNGNRGIFHMLLTEVEQVLNGCALTANSDDPHDLQAIMYPSHFAMHRNTTAYPPPPPPGSFGRTGQFYQRRWKQGQFLVHLFWKRWLRQYLPSFQVREKGRRALLNLKLNAPVLLVDEPEP